MLWNMTPQDLWPIAADAGEELLRFSPVVLASELQQVPHHEVLAESGQPGAAGFGVSCV
jgi:DNA polymerase-3 subunit chi